LGADSYYQVPVDSSGKLIATNIDALGHSQYIRERCYPGYRASNNPTSHSAGRFSIVLFNSSTEYRVIVDGVFISSSEVPDATIARYAVEFALISSKTGGSDLSAHAPLDSSDSLVSNVKALSAVSATTKVISLATLCWYAGTQNSNVRVYGFPYMNRINLVTKYARNKGIVLPYGYGVSIEEKITVTDSKMYYYDIDYHTELNP